MEKVEELTLTDEIRAAFHGDDPAQKDRALCRAYDFMIAHTAGGVEPVRELAAMLDAVTFEEGAGIFEHTAEEIGLHVMENYQAIRKALYAHPPAPIDAEAMPPWYCQLPDAVHAEVVKHVREIQSFTVGFSDQQIGVMAEAVYNALVDARALPLPEGDEG